MLLKPIKVKQPPELTLLDKKLLDLLSQNSRRPILQLAKKLNTSQPLILYRINRLKSILNLEFAITIDYSKLGYRQYFILLYDTLTNNQYNKLNDLIKEIPHHLLTNTLVGKYKHLYLFATKKEDKLQELLINLQEFRIKYEVIEAIYNDMGYFAPLLKNKENIKTKVRKDNTIKRININLINEISNNPIAPLVELSNKLNLDPLTIKKRLRELEENRVILNYGIHIQFLGLVSTYYLLISAPNKEVYSKLYSYIFNNPIFSWMWGTIGQCHLIAFGVFIQYSELLEFIDKIKEMNEEIQIEPLQIASQEEINLFPEKMIQELKEFSR